MSTVTLKNVKKVYPFSGDDIKNNKAKEKKLERLKRRDPAAYKNYMERQEEKAKAKNAEEIAKAEAEKKAAEEAKKAEEEAKKAAEAKIADTEIALLKEIRDLLKK